MLFAEQHRKDHREQRQDGVVKVEPEHAQRGGNDGKDDQTNDFLLHGDLLTE